jgi:hypothetical protein
MRIALAGWRRHMQSSIILRESDPSCEFLGRAWMKASDSFLAAGRIAHLPGRARDDPFPVRFVLHQGLGEVARLLEGDMWREWGHLRICLHLEQDGPAGGQGLVPRSAHLPGIVHVNASIRSARRNGNFWKALNFESPCITRYSQVTWWGSSLLKTQTTKRRSSHRRQYFATVISSAMLSSAWRRRRRVRSPACRSGRTWPRSRMGRPRPSMPSRPRAKPSCRAAS